MACQHLLQHFHRKGRGYALVDLGIFEIGDPAVGIEMDCLLVFAGGVTRFVLGQQAVAFVQIEGRGVRIVFAGILERGGGFCRHTVCCIGRGDGDVGVRILFVYFDGSVEGFYGGGFVCLQQELSFAYFIQGIFGVGFPTLFIVVLRFRQLSGVVGDLAQIIEGNRFFHRGIVQLFLKQFSGNIRFTGLVEVDAGIVVCIGNGCQQADDLDIDVASHNN